MVEPPFLEFQFVLHSDDMRASLAELGLDANIKSATDERVVMQAPGIIGISETGPEEIDAGKNLLIIRTEGEKFCGSFRRQRRQLEKLGDKAFKRFVEIAESINCLYGAILLEYSLEKPEELRDRRSYAFKNFYVSKRYTNSHTLKDVISIAGKRSYLEDLSNGIYISMSSEFNPAHKSLDFTESEERSVLIGQKLSRMSS